MASKGQKFKNHSPEIKEMILIEYFSGNGSSYSLARKYNISRSSLHNWIKKAKNNINVTTDGRGRLGRPKTRNLTLEDYKERYEILKKYQAFLQARRGKK